MLVSPTRTTPASTRRTRPARRAEVRAEHVAAIEAAGYDADVWDVDAQGVPHDLGVLSHYDAVVWYLGDNRLTQDPEDEFIDTPFGALPDIGGGRAPAVPDDGRARLPQRGRQARPRR